MLKCRIMYGLKAENGGIEFYIFFFEKLILRKKKLQETKNNVVSLMKVDKSRWKSQDSSSEAEDYLE